MRMGNNLEWHLSYDIVDLILEKTLTLDKVTQLPPIRFHNATNKIIT